MKKILIALGLLAATGSAFAASYQVYSQPNANSKVLGKISDQSADQYIQFYKQGNWVKIADTQTGAVGWVNVAGTSTQASAQNSQAQRAAQYQQAYNLIQAQQQQLEAQRKTFEQNYQQAAQQLSQRMQALQQQVSAENQATVNRVNQTNANNKALNPAGSTQTQKSFNALSIQTNKDGKTATVTKEWLGQDGKMHKSVKQVPLSQLQSMQLS